MSHEAEAPSRPSFVLDDEVDNLGAATGATESTPAQNTAHATPQPRAAQSPWTSWFGGSGANAKPGEPTWRESMWKQWETGTGWFGPLVPEPSKQEQQAADRERREQSWESRPKRPGLVTRLSSAVSMTLYPPRQRSDSQPQR